jgi:TPR repeat protein
VSRGDAHFANGDVASARMFYRQAAEAGHGFAALRVGLSFDPAFLTRVRITQVAGDIDSAVHWYRRARELGNAEAEILLKGVAPGTR